MFSVLVPALRRVGKKKQASVAWESLEQARRMDGGGLCNIPMVMRPRRLDAAYLQNKVGVREMEFKGVFLGVGRFVCGTWLV